MAESFNKKINTNVVRFGEQEYLNNLNNPNNIQIQLKHPDAQIPSRGYYTDAGADLHSVESLEIGAGKRACVNTGVAIAIPMGYYGRIAPRSGLAFRNGIDILAGVVDYGYTDSIKVILLNTGDIPIKVNVGDRIAQILIEKLLENPNFIVVDNLKEADRGTRGFGSTGK